MSDNETLVSSFRQTSPYINAYRKKTFVIMFPGAAISNANFGNMIQDIALLYSLGIRLILVHGAREQIDERLQANGFDSVFHRKLRITPKEHINCLLQAVGSTRFVIEAALSRGLPNSAMHHADISVNSGNLVTGMPLGVVEGINYQYTGKVRSIAKQALNSILSRDGIVLISPIGFSATGELFNLAYTDIATQVAIQMQADKLISFNKNNGIVDANHNLYRQLTLLQCKQLLSSEASDDGYESLNACYTACNQGVTRAQLISYADDGALIKELFTRDGIGTMVHRDDYEVIRRGHINDVGGIIELITPLEKEGVLVRRSRELLEQEIENFTIIEKDGMVVACAALYPFIGEAAGELACVATHPAYRGSGRAGKLLQYIEKQAKESAIKRLFVLTTQASHWFVERGFTSAEPDNLPTKKKLLYNYHRNSQVFVKDIV